MSVADEITRLQSAKTAIAAAIEGKGVTVPAATKLDGYSTLVGQIPTGITPSGTKEITANGTYDVASFASALVSVSPRLQTKIAHPSTASVIVRPDEGYDGLSAVNIFKVTSAIDANIVAGNIKKDVTILGVTGTLEGGGGIVSVEWELPVYNALDNIMPWSVLTSAGLSYTTLNDLFVIVEAYFDHNLDYQFTGVRRNSGLSFRSTTKMYGIGVYNGNSVIISQALTESRGTTPRWYYDSSGIHFLSGTSGRYWGSSTNKKIRVSAFEFTPFPYNS